MAVPAWDTNPTRTVRMVVRVEGAIREHSSVTWGQSLNSSLPDPVAGAGSFGHRTGTIEWARPAINTTLPSPWSTAGGWLPVDGQTVTVDAVDGKGNEVRVFTGRIDETSGDAAGGLVSNIVDRIDDFNRTVRSLATSFTGSFVAGDVRRQGTSVAWALDDVLRQCNYFSTPPPPPGLILDAPLQGSTYVYSDPGSGFSNAFLVSSQQKSSSPGHPQWADTSFGLASCDMTATYSPYSGPGSGDTSLRLSLVIHKEHGSDAEMIVYKADGGYVSLRVDGVKRVIVSSRIGAAGAITTHTVFTLPADSVFEAVSAIYRGGTVSVASTTTAETSRTLSTPTGAVDRVVVSANLVARISGVQVSDPGTNGGHIAAQWVPTARYSSTGTLRYPVSVSPSIRDENARDVLGGFAAALLCPVFLDEYGVLRVTPSSYLHSQTPDITVDTLTSVAEMGWETSLSHRRSAVTVHWADAVVSMNSLTGAQSILCYQGPGSSLSPGDRLEEFIEVPADEEWLGINLSNITHMYQPTAATLAKFNAGDGSFWGASRDVESEAYPDAQTWTSYVWQTFERINPWKWKVVTTATGEASLNSPNGIELRKKFREMNLPVVRGTGRVVRTDSKVMAGTNSYSYPTLDHDMGRWGTRSDHATALANWIYGMVTNPHPVVRDLTIRFDPRVNIGMVLRVNSERLHGVTITGMVLGVDHDPATDTTRVSIRVTSATSPYATYADFQAAWAGADYAALTSAWAAINGTYQALTDNPLQLEA